MSEVMHGLTLLGAPADQKTQTWQDSANRSRQPNSSICFTHLSEAKCMSCFTNKRLELSTGQVDRFTAVRILGPGNSDSGKARQETSRNCSKESDNSSILTAMRAISHKHRWHRCSEVFWHPWHPLQTSLSFSLGHGSESAAGAGKIGRSTAFATQAARAFAWHMLSSFA